MLENTKHENDGSAKRARAAVNEKKTQAFVQKKRSWFRFFWKSQVYWDYSITTDKIGRVGLAELADLGLDFHLAKSILPPVLQPVVKTMRI